jgi:ABC-type multidrug transport system fused ATPase/permease subunit
VLLVPAVVVGAADLWLDPHAAKTVAPITATNAENLLIHLLPALLVRLRQLSYRFPPSVALGPSSIDVSGSEVWKTERLLLQNLERKVMDLLATNYPLLDVFWTMLWFFLFFIWIWLLITIFVDIFRSQDLSGWAKALWVIFVIVVPFLGILFYLIFRGGSMHERALQQAQQQETEFREYVQDAAQTSSADQLTKLADLRDRGVITEEEFQRQKAAVLSS